MVLCNSTLLFCYLEITLLRSGISVQPRLQYTPFVPLLPMLPLAPGAPIHLLPFSTPAYYLNTYSGPTQALVKAFLAAFADYGVGGFLTEAARWP